MFPAPLNFPLDKRLILQASVIDWPQDEIKRLKTATKEYAKRTLG
jgi:hypothetical protein